MKKIYSLAFIFSVLFLVACSNTGTISDQDIEENQKKNNPEEHQVENKHAEYLSTYGWEIKKWNSQSEEEVNYLPEKMKKLNVNGVDLYGYEGEKVSITTYVLKEKQKNGERIFASVYEINDKIIGITGTFENKVPGDFSLKNRNELLEKEAIVEEN